MNKKNLLGNLVAAASVVFAAFTVAATASAVRHHDPQDKLGVFDEPGIFRVPGQPDSAFEALTVWDNNHFVLIGSFGTTLDPAHPDFFEWADDSACTGSQRNLNCTATDHVYLVSSSGVALQGAFPFGWSMTSLAASNVVPTAFAFADGESTSITAPVTSSSLCLSALTEMRSLLTTTGDHPEVRLDNALCP